MFQFRRFPTYTYLIQCTLPEYCSGGFPHSEIHGSRDICSSPWLIAACRVLLRLSVPRHSPCALYSLTNQKLQLSLRSRLLNYAGNPDIFVEIVIVTLHLSRCCSTIKILLSSELFIQKTSLLPYFTFIIHCSVFKVQLVVAKSALLRFRRWLAPRQNFARSLAPPLRRKQVFGDTGTTFFPASFEARSKHLNPFKCFDLISNGGDSRVRTGDLLLARQALSQLSYIPGSSSMFTPSGASFVVGPSGLEPPTLR